MLTYPRLLIIELFTNILRGGYAMTTPLIVAGYILFTLCLGFYMRKTNNSIAQFFVAKRELTPLLIVPLMFAEQIAGSGTIGAAQAGFNVGFSGGLAMWGNAIGNILFLIFVSKLYRVAGAKLNAISVAEVFSIRFGKWTRLTMMFTMSVTFSLLFSLQVVAAAALIAPMFNLNMTVAMWLCSIFFITMSVTGGLKGLAWMNALHSTVMYTCMGITTIVCVRLAGGFSVIANTLPSTYFTATQPNLNVVIADMLGVSIACIASAANTQVTMGARSLKDAYKGTIVASVLLAVFALLPCLIGMAGKVYMPDANSSSILYTMAGAASPVIAGMASMAILAAITSTGPAMLLVVSSTITRDLYKPIIKKDATEKQELAFSKFSIIVVGILMTILAMSIRSLLSTFVGALQMRAAAGIVLVLGLYWKRIDDRAAAWSILLGGIVSLVWYFSGNPFGIPALWASVAVCLTLVIALSLLAKEKVNSGYMRYKNALDEAEADGSL